MTEPSSDQTHLLIASMPLAESLGIHLDSAEAHEVRGHLDWAASLCTLGGYLHGGAIMTLADSLGAICGYLHLSDGATTSTIESTSNFFHGIRAGRLHGVCRPLHAGRTTITVRTELFDDQQRLVAHTTQTQAVLTEQE
ncbi:uncharacterized protein (TIGR00369 family) [Halopolyspora algeriensis]|uniref:Uncharacterized protein (TIGR00369 family) n=1 Tax=Halopolyspora algeriensis TaxID=1500506 RepID=A0A368VW64_9ACTN|nr:PaaI family thioesterase [Halopolyspora algeriensis]RCW46083.1 uncharacterized protein (TIGR00369 family) [Halopolyspora algeriensis]TQM55488.1 uncharacterized protein (TIGR00369 family) [Halopolyspora algeriensis]